MHTTKRTFVILALFLLTLLLVSGVVMAREAETFTQAETSQHSDALAIALDYLRENKAVLGLTEADLAQVRVTDQYVSQNTGVTHIYLVQTLDGVEVYNGLININVMPDGRILNYGNRFVPNLRGQVQDNKAALTAEQAVTLAAAHLNLTISQPLQILDHKISVDQQTLLSDGGISQNPIPAKLVYDASGDNVLLAWNVIIYQLDSQHWWNVRVDANSGAVLSQNDWVVSENFDAHQSSHMAANTAAAAPALTQAGQNVPFSPTPVADGSSYRVYQIPVESPSHSVPPSPADGRTLQNTPADANGSPFGWQDTNGAAGAEFTTTQGNNVHAYTDTNNDNSPDPGSSPDGGAGLDFDFPLDLTLAPSAYRPAAVTNLFYWNNLMHDIPYLYGFDDAAGNFQENNYGRGGLGSDYVYAEAQDGGGTNNANFGTPPDGDNPRMQMYIWTSPNPDRDGDLDNGIVAHEYGHGISNRLVGGPSNVGCLGNQEQMGEGWSDWQSVILTMRPGDTGTTNRGVGTYALGQPTNGVGIRPAPYNTDLGVNGYTYSNLPSMAVPHGVGFVWNTMLWEMNWGLIGVHGFNPDMYGDWTTGGNNLAYQLVSDGMKLTACGPGFVDGRDAILAADVALTGGENQCTIWTAFAKRGLGYSASQGSPDSRSDGTAAFDMPPGCLTLDAAPDSQAICQGDVAEYLVSVGTDFTPPVNMSATGNPAPSTIAFDVNPVTSVPGITNMSVENTGSVAAGSYTITIEGDDGPTNHTVDVGLDVVAGVPGAPTLTSPANGATGVSTNPTLTWNAVASTADYLVEIATDAAFNDIVYTAVEATTSHLVDLDLTYGVTYYWRVTAQNVCGGGAASAVFNFTTEFLPGSCEPGSSTVIQYETDLEDGAPGWTHSGTQDSWTLSGAQTTSGVNAWFAIDFDSLSDQRLVSPAIVLPAVTESPITLRFENRQAFETPNTDGRCWDAGILEISTNGGSSWAQVPQSALLSDPYDNIIWNDQAGNNPITNDYGATMAWCDPGAPPTWVTSVVDLDAYAGDTVQFRWRLGTDSAAGNEGWYLDDISVQSCVDSAYGVALSPDDATDAAAGTAVNYQVTITNTGDMADTFDLAVSGESWTTTLSTASVSLAAGASATFTATVDIPAGALGGDSDTATVTATSTGDGGQSDSTNLTTSVTIVRDVQLSATDVAINADPGMMVTYTVHLTNTGNVADDFTLSMSGNNWETHVEPTTATLDAGEGTAVTVVVHIPVDAVDGDEDTVTITAVSDSDASVTDSIDLTTAVGPEMFTIYLPAIMKP